jgi:hypothetical protein
MEFVGTEEVDTRTELINRPGTNVIKLFTAVSYDFS